MTHLNHTPSTYPAKLAVILGWQALQRHLWNICDDFFWVSERKIQKITKNSSSQHVLNVCRRSVCLHMENFMSPHCKSKQMTHPSDPAVSLPQILGYTFVLMLDVERDPPLSHHSTMLRAIPNCVSCSSVEPLRVIFNRESTINLSFSFQCFKMFLIEWKYIPQSRHTHTVTGASLERAKITLRSLIARSEKSQVSFFSHSESFGQNGCCRTDRKKHLREKFKKNPQIQCWKLFETLRRRKLWVEWREVFSIPENIFDVMTKWSEKKWKSWGGKFELSVWQFPFFPSSAPHFP